MAVQGDRKPRKPLEWVREHVATVTNQGSLNKIIEVAPRIEVNLTFHVITFSDWMQCAFSALAVRVSSRATFAFLMGLASLD